MDLFEKIDQFEKLANELSDSDESDDVQTAETIEEYLNEHMERSAAAKARMRKLAALLKR